MIWNCLLVVFSCSVNTEVTSFRFGRSQEIPSLDEIFGNLNSTITDTVVISDSAKVSVNDSLEAGVQDINYTQYHEQVS